MSRAPGPVLEAEMERLAEVSPETAVLGSYRRIEQVKNEETVSRRKA